MSDQNTQLNTKDTNSNQLVTKNINTIDNLIVKEVETSMKELAGDINDLESIMKILRDKMIESTEVGFPISLARFAEIKLATRRQKNELLKTLITYKTNEQASRKRSSDASSSVQDIMAGIGLGAALTSGKKLDISGPGINTRMDIERTDVVDVEIEIEEGETTSSSLPKVITNG